MENKIPAIDRDQFYNYFSSISTDKELADQHAFYSSTIDGLKTYAISPYFWFITNSIEMKTRIVSDNIGQFTPFTKEEWLDSDSSTDFFINLFHPDDRLYLMGAFEFISKMFYALDESERRRLRINYYSRMLDKNKNYRWVLILCPLLYRNKKREIESSLVVIYDFSHFQINNQPLLSIMDFSNNEVQYFKYIEKNIKLIDVKKAIITKREKEILKLMASGLNTPEIASALFISYHTVQNHKKNLRKKTNTKTASELISYAMTHSMLLL